MVVLGLALMTLLGAVATVHLRRTSDDVEYSPLVARARRGPDGGHIGSNTDRLLAAQRKRARRTERNLQIAGRRSSRHLENGQPPTAPMVAAHGKSSPLTGPTRRGARPTSFQGGCSVDQPTNTSRARTKGEHDNMGELLLHVEHGSRLARAWLAASSAATNDPERPALHRTTLVELFDTGVRLSATDSYWTAVAWCGNPEDPGDPVESDVLPPPGRGEVPELVVPVVDHEYRIRDLMAFVKRRTQTVDDNHPDVAVTMTITRDRDEDVPTLDPLFDRDRVDVQIPGIEQVAGYVNDVSYPDVARLHWQHDQHDTTDVDQVQLSPELLRKMAKAVSSIGSQGVVLGFHGESTKPISWSARKPAAADLSGLLMPQRPVRTEQLVDALGEVDRQLVTVGLLRPPRPPAAEYRIALRPDDRLADPMDPKTLLDDIVVMRPAMFRAEQMDPSTWWVACYLDETTNDRICWTVTAHARPKHLSWTGYEYPDAAIYEHDLEAVTP